MAFTLLSLPAVSNSLNASLNNSVLTQRSIRLWRTSRRPLFPTGNSCLPLQANTRVQNSAK